MRRIFSRTIALILFLSLLTPQNLVAQLEAGKVYQFISKSFPGSSMSVMPNDARRELTWVPTNVADYNQLWYAEVATKPGQFTLRNLSTGGFLKGAFSRSALWTVVDRDKMDAKCYFYSIKNDIAYYITTNASAMGATCMSCNKVKNRIVSWNAVPDKASWEIQEVQMKDDSWKNNFDDMDAIQGATVVQAALKALFVDDACTVLKNPSANLSNDANFLKLPPTLQQMALKVQSGDWTEQNETDKPQWDSDYAKKFRVQLYEAYCDPNEASAALMINPHTNLNNPTGLYGNNHQMVYVMVDGKIKPGARLYWGAIVGHGQPSGNPDTGITLKEGLNIIQVKADQSAFFINYIGDTFKGGKKTGYKMSDFPDLKIHIEGGYINGYYNAVGDELYRPDKDADWNYYEERANCQNITVLGKYQTLQFFLNDTPDNKGNLCPGLRRFFTDKVSVEKVVETWDRIQFSERLTLGLLGKEEIEAAKQQYPTLDDPSRGLYSYMGDDENMKIDYSDLYRLHGLSLSVQKNFMFASAHFSGYNINVLHKVVESIVADPRSVWGPSHEIGHQHQRAINMTGLTEVSNNLFSHVSLWFKGEVTSRINSYQGAFVNISNEYDREGNDFFTNVYTNKGWGLSQMYYKLWLYYHLIGHNNKFYPHLFEMLRHDPMAMGPEPTDGGKTLLHFYKMCCKASGEDLTDFFKAYDMFQPMNYREVGDYSSRHYNMTQEQVDAAIREVKSWNLPMNYCALFINDATKDVTYGHDGKTPRILFDWDPTSEYGNYTYYYQGKVIKADDNYSAILENSTIKISGGSGGVGFVVYDDDMELLAFSDRAQMNLSPKALKALKSKHASLYVVDGDNTMKKVKLHLPECIVEMNQSVLQGSFDLAPVEAQIEVLGDTIDIASNTSFSCSPNLLIDPQQPVAKNLGLFVFNRLLPQMNAPMTATFTITNLPKDITYNQLTMKLHFLWGTGYAPENANTKSHLSVTSYVGKDKHHLLRLSQRNYPITKAGGVNLALKFPTKQVAKAGEDLVVKIQFSKGTSGVANGYLGLSDVALSYYNFDDEQVGIEQLENNEDVITNDIYYDLSGRCVLQPQRGIYIKNGKKVYIQ